jgi:nitrous oxidase accessory protein NosD
MSDSVLRRKTAIGARWPPVFGLCALLLTAYIAVGGAQAAAPMHATLKVPTQYPTIQSAINAAHAGDTILVGAGTYTEQLTIDTSVSLLGAGAGRTAILQPAGTDYAMEIGNAATVTVSGFTITATAANQYSDAIFVWNGATATISGNTVQALGYSDIAIEVSYVSSATITGNTIVATSSPDIGLQVGIGVLDLSHATIRYNTIVGPGVDGILLFASTATVANNVIGQFECGWSNAFSPCGTDWLNDYQGGGVVDYFDLGATTIANNLIYTTDDGVQLAGGSPGVTANGNVILNSVNYGLACFDQVCSFSHDAVLGGQYGVGVAATSVVTSATLDHVLIGGTTVATFYYEADLGMPVPTIGGTYTIL